MVSAPESYTILTSCVTSANAALRRHEFLRLAVSSEHLGIGDGYDRHAQDRIDWKATDRLLAYPKTSFIELARPAFDRTGHIWERPLEK